MTLFASKKSEPDYVMSPWELWRLDSVGTICRTTTRIKTEQKNEKEIRRNAPAAPVKV